MHNGALIPVTIIVTDSSAQGYQRFCSRNVYGAIICTVVQSGGYDALRYGTQRLGPPRIRLAG